MELKDQVCSLELAIRLKELGVKQESLFYWDSHCIEELKTQGKYGITSDGEYSAFTVAELWGCFPVSICDYFLTIKMYRDNLFYVSYSDDIENLKSIAFVTKNGADAMAKMLIYLLENSLVKLEEVNDRIS